MRKKRKERPDKFKMNAMMSLIKEGRTRREVAKMFDYSEQSISRWAIEHGLRKHNTSQSEAVQMKIDDVAPEAKEIPKRTSIDSMTVILQNHERRMDQLEVNRKLSQEKFKKENFRRRKTFSFFWGLIKFNY